MECTIIDTIQVFTYNIARLSVHVLDLLAILIILGYSFMGLYKLLRRQGHILTVLLNGLSMSLTFKIGSEIIRLITVHTMDEILQIAAIIAIKAALTYLIHWDLKAQKEEAHD